MAVDVRRIDPDDDEGLVAAQAVLEASDREVWPELASFSVTDFRAFARFEGATRRFELMAATERGSHTHGSRDVLGIGLLEFPLRDNLHAVEVTVAVHPDRRRRGVGTAIVEALGARALAERRRTLNTVVNVPVALAPTHPSTSFAPHVGFVTTLGGNSRHLRLPADARRIDGARAAVATARLAGHYRTFTFEAPWPEEFVADECALLRVMSTDEPAGDGEREEESWDAERIAESDALHVARHTTKLTAVSQHLPSGRLVALSEILLSDDTAHQAWQLATVVHPEHRGHRLGLAVKIANLDFLARRAPAVRLVTTANASVNAPMIAVNDMLGFVVAGEGHFWQKQLAPAPA